MTLLDNGIMTFDKKARAATLRRGESSQSFEHDDFREITTAHLHGGMAYLFDAYRKTVYVFDLKNGQFKFEFGGRGRGEGSLGEVVRILSDSGDKIYLADAGSTKVQIFSADGIFSTQFGERGTSEEGMIGAIADMAWTGKDLAVLDSTREVVHVFSASGEHLRELPVPIASPVLS